ncbi:MAG: hypothetical protein ABIH76_02560 [Candidatus Bathyarchaeota archaeon]
MPRYAVKLYYDGKNFNGFQSQKDRRTAAAEILSALKRSGLISDSNEAKFQAASRTDKGASALSQTIAFTTDQRFSTSRLNAFLPHDIKAWSWAYAPNAFNPQRDALERNYVYTHPYSGENLELMLEASKILLGSHDFRNFVKRTNGPCIKTLTKLAIKKNKDILAFSFSSKSFARGMIRKIMTVILEIGRGKTSVGYLKKLLNPAFKPLGGVYPAKAENLALFNIKYKLKFNVDKRSQSELIEKLKDEVTSAEIKRLCVNKLT